MKSLLRLCSYLVSFVILIPDLSAVAQALPLPTGSYPVGRLRLHWLDKRRPEVLAANSAADREINLEVWYPAEAQTSKIPADYIPDMQTIRAAIPDQEFRDEFDSAADLVKSGQIKTHSQVGLKIAAAPARFPVLIFSHGLGVPPEGYTSQTEDLASHGFIVIAIEHTYDAFVSVFPDKRIVDYEEAVWDSKKGAAHAAYTHSRVDVWADDILFVIDQLFELKKGHSLPVLWTHLDMQRLGVFGHSMGGLAAIAACQQNRRISACLDEDSLINNEPFTHPERRLTQPYLILLTSSNYSPRRTDAQLAKGGITRFTFNENVLRSQEQLKASLHSHGGRASLVVLSDPSIEHMNFSDFKVLQSQDETQARSSNDAIMDIRTIVLSFFQRNLMRSEKKSRRLVQGSLPAAVIPLR